MLGIYHLVIRRFIVVKNRSQGVTIYLPVGKINIIYAYIWYIFIHIYIYNFDVTIGSYDGADVCELSGIFMLKECSDETLNIFWWRSYRKN